MFVICLKLLQCNRSVLIKGSVQWKNDLGLYCSLVLP